MSTAACGEIGRIVSHCSLIRCSPNLPTSRQHTSTTILVLPLGSVGSSTAARHPRMNQEAAAMQRSRVFTAIGLMSGTSMDGIDVALLTTDGSTDIVEAGAWLTVPYTCQQRRILVEAMKAITTIPLAATKCRAEWPQEVKDAEQLVTEQHIRAVQTFLSENNLRPANIDVVGFHGQTLVHSVAHKVTLQIGNGNALAKAIGIDVVQDFRTADMVAGGQGAPLAALYHAACAKQQAVHMAKSRVIDPHHKASICILNIGGVANLTYMDQNDQIMAFDTGPGNALIDDWMHYHSGAPMDNNGAAAAKGKAHNQIVEQFLSSPWFQMPPPKSIDRQMFASLLKEIQPLGIEDGAATLTACTVRSVQKAVTHLPTTPSHWIVCGGGRHNITMFNLLKECLENVSTADDMKWPGDELEAQAFAWLAVRSLRALPLSIPQTTGCRSPTTGGVLCKHEV